MMAYRLQAEAYGDLDRKTTRMLERLADGAADKSASNGPSTPNSDEGQKPDGFGWNGATYASLSGAAFAITGTKWNGHRFFGLRHQDRIWRASAPVIRIRGRALWLAARLPIGLERRAVRRRRRQA